MISLANLIKCSSCGKLKKHKARRLCLECYRNIYNKEYRERKDLRKYSNKEIRKIKRNCKNCDKSFPLKNVFAINKKYCSDKCRNNWLYYFGGKKIVCKNCNEEKRHYGNGLCRKCWNSNKKKIKNRCYRCKKLESIKALNLCSSCYDFKYRHKNKKGPLTVKCLLCESDFVRINTTHLKKEHGITLEQYKDKFPNVELSKYPIGVQRLKGKELTKHQSKAGKLVKNRTKCYPSQQRYWEKNHDKWKEKEKKRIKSSLDSQRKKKRYLWSSVFFDSKEERNIAKLLLDKPIVGKNCQIPVGGIFIDFFIKSKVFIEYHSNWSDPRNKMNTKEGYMAQRLNIIKKSEYKGIPIEFIFDRKNYKEQVNEIKKKYSL